MATSPPSGGRPVKGEDSFPFSTWSSSSVAYLLRFFFHTMFVVA